MRVTLTDKSRTVSLTDNATALIDVSMEVGGIFTLDGLCNTLNEALAGYTFTNVRVLSAEFEREDDRRGIEYAVGVLDDLRRTAGRSETERSALALAIETLEERAKS